MVSKTCSFLGLDLLIFFRTAFFVKILQQSIKDNQIEGQYLDFRSLKLFKLLELHVKLTNYYLRAKIK